MCANRVHYCCERGKKALPLRPARQVRSCAHPAPRGLDEAPLSMASGLV
jgi:hypothetical protein